MIGARALDHLDVKFDGRRTHRWMSGKMESDSSLPTTFEVAPSQKKEIMFPFPNNGMLIIVQSIGQCQPMVTLRPLFIHQ